MLISAQCSAILQQRVRQSIVIVHLSSATLDVSSSQALERCVPDTSGFEMRFVSSVVTPALQSMQMNSEMSC